MTLPVSPPGARRARKGRSGAVAAVGMASVALAACSSGSGSSSQSTTSTRPATSTSSSTSTSTTGPTTTTTTTAGLAGCQVSQLGVSPQQGSGAAGTIELSVDLTNRSGTACTLFGYPGMQLLDGSGNNLPTNVIRGGGPQFSAPAANRGPATVVLAPAQSAAFSLSYEDVPVGNETSCPTSAGALITPPGDFTSARVTLAIAPCGGGTIHVSPVYAT